MGDAVNALRSLGPKLHRAARRSARRSAAPELSDEQRPRATRGWQARQRRIERAVWITLAAVPLAALAVLGCLALFIRPQPVNTGDKVLDAFMQQLYDRDELVPSNSIGMQVSGYWPLPGRMDPATLTDLQQRYAGDPRLSLLLYHFSGDTESTPRYYGSATGTLVVPPAGVSLEQPTERQSSVAGIAVDPSVQYLEQARAGGYADAAVLVRLLRAYSGAWNSHAQALYGEPSPGRNAPQSEVMAYFKAIRLEQDRLFGEQERQLLSELFAAAPDEALPHYYAAQFAAERGDYEAALAELRAGNRAPRNTTMVGFPFDILYRQARQGQAVGDKLISGWLASAAQFDALPNYILFKCAVKNMVYMASERRDLAALDELHTFGCRFGSMEGGSVIDGLVGQVLVKLVYKAVVKDRPVPISAEQSKALGELHTKFGALLSQTKALSSRYNSLNQFQMPQNPQQAARYVLQLGVDQLSGGRSTNIRYLEASNDMLVAEQTALAGQISQTWAEIARFDYKKIGWD